MKTKMKSPVLISGITIILLLSSLACNSFGRSQPTPHQSTENPTTRPTQTPTAKPVEVVVNEDSHADSGEVPVNAALPGSFGVIGTIQATIDGKLKKWAVIDDSNCLWGAIIHGSSIGFVGYEDSDKVFVESIDFKQSIWPNIWVQPYDLGNSRITFFFENPNTWQSQGTLDLSSNPRHGATAGDMIFLSYTTASGDFIHGVTKIQSEYTDNGDGTLTLAGHFTTSGFAERDSSGLDQLPGVTDGTFEITGVRLLDPDQIRAWRAACAP